MKTRMFISKTPLRITFVGGGTDIKDYYSKRDKGAVLSASINKFIYIVVNKKFDDKIRVSYSKTEIVDSVDRIEHPSVREALKLLQIDGGIEIVSISDIPSGGTGLGSSSTFLVGLLNALHAWKGEFASPEQLSQEAVKIEREILREPGGKQDQYMAAYGGINMLEFYPDETVVVKPVISSETVREKLQENLLLLYTGVQRGSAEIHSSQARNVGRKSANYDKMVQITEEAFSSLSMGDYDSIGSYLHSNWRLKKELTEGISSDFIDQAYEKAIQLGATGGKLIGAGGGGFMLFYARPELHETIVREIGNMKPEQFRFEFQGSRIIHVGD
ncbi:MAG: kinase [Candidatus Thermoplasmatota archaeon]|nr:kinase [Candidatus Thermoplasmatota archaeon]